MKLRSAEKLQEAMDFRGVKTRVELARLADLGPGIIGHLLSGERSSCSAETAAAIEEALGCRPGYLFLPSESTVDKDHRPKDRGNNIPDHGRSQTVV